ncbi:hypothetical protein UP06_18740 [Bradyrhizobium sp. LTSP857]|nr:hypothetical protein UP06_18740 [Bradyrhizobium sp. LTSP857]
MRDILIFLAIGAGIVLWDHQAGGILPDGAYCLLGAGVTSRSAARETAWHVDPSTGRQTPFEWSAPSEVCLHTTLWSAYRGRLQTPAGIQVKE